MKRITFINIVFVITILFAACNVKKDNTTKTELPNILWITCEDITTMQGSYGDQNALTPNLDKLASEGVQFNTAYSTAAVCSPARSCLVTGVYATSLGTQNLRSEFRIPHEIQTLPHILRKHGYYCTNNSKEDYNFTDSSIWDESSKTAHWRHRNEGQPFYSVFNIETTHQSQIFGDDESFYIKYGQLLTDVQRHKPSDIVLPPYFFDTPMVRKLWARYYDLVTIMDQQVAEILDQLKEDALDENTIIFYFSDHGTGMPRAKRALYNSGVQVPFIIKAPEKYQKSLNILPGSENEKIISFIDLPPTMLSIAGIDIPRYMQGNVFLGKKKATEVKYAFACSDRVDEAYELSRTVKSGKFSYIRNFLPHLPLIKPNYYSDKSEIMKELYRVTSELSYSQMTPEQQSMWHPKRAPEELYDLENDPFEINNLATDPSHRETMLAMRQALKDWMIETHDSGMIPEGYLLDNTHEDPAYTVTQQADIYPLEKILKLNDLILGENIEQLKLAEYLSDSHELVRFWAAVSLQYVENPIEPIIQKLEHSLNDNSLQVKLAVAETLCSYALCSKKAQHNILIGLQSENEATMLYASRIYELQKDRASDIYDNVEKIYLQICEKSNGKWKGYDLYSCWALTEAFQE